MVPLRCITQMACFAHGGDLMTWCNNSLKAGKGKIMDCKKYMFIDTFPHCLDFCRAQPPRHAARDAVWEGACAGRDPPPAARAGERGPGTRPLRTALAGHNLAGKGQQPLPSSAERGNKAPPTWEPEGCALRVGGTRLSPLRQHVVPEARGMLAHLPREGQVLIPLSARPHARGGERQPQPRGQQRTGPFCARLRAPADAEERQPSEICQISVPAQCTGFKYKLCEERLTSLSVSRSSESFDHLPNKTLSPPKDTPLQAKK